MWVKVSQYVARHRKIIAAVKGGDAAGARAEMQEHLRHVKATMALLFDADVLRA
jgi:DNA-binding GntR family transcriptional regulator